MTEREFALDVVQRLQEAGHAALWAGGCVRDELLGLIPKDYDIATEATPTAVQALFRRTIAVGLSFGVVEVIGPRVEGQHLKVQVATFRSDGTYSDGRRPDVVIFSSPEEDAQRRDFTINGMFFDPVQQKLIDFVGGQKDLEDKILRAIGDPVQRFQEDKLRLLRAVRIAARFEFEIESATRIALQQMAAQIKVVSAERIGEELRKLLVDRHRVRGAALLMDLGLLEQLLPEFLLLSKQENFWPHTLKVLGFLEEEASFPLAFATLLHSISQIETPEKSSTAKINSPAVKIADRLRLSNAEKDQIVWLLENQRALAGASQQRPSQLKKLLVHPNIQELFTFHRALALATGEVPHEVAYCEELLQTWTEADLNPVPFLGGQDLKGLNLKPGPRYKELLDTVRDAQLDGTITSRSEAIALVSAMLKGT